LLFVLLVPEQATEEHLQILSELPSAFPIGPSVKIADRQRHGYRA
jgi:hypothetical protein